jgi:serine/threonine protein kinase
VEALLDSDEYIGDFLEPPATPVTSGEESTDISGLLPDDRVGAYRLLCLIAKGGMGTVYLAERADGQYRKQVAIKFINSQFADGDLVTRFLNERQVLATLDHPHIARLLDGGATENGVPYLVMEYIDGERIDHWCDARRLPVRGRLVLFRKICC